VRVGQAALCALALLASCDAVSIVAHDKIQNPAGTDTTATVVASATPVSGDTMVLRVVLGQTQSSVTPPTGFTLACSVSAINAYIFTHVAGSSENPNYGSMSWSTASAGTIVIGERSGVNTTTPVSGCAGASIASTVLSPSYSLGTITYGGSVAEGVFETATLGRCTGGAGTCNASGYTETGYDNSGVFGESQTATAPAPTPGATVLINFNSTGSSSVRVAAYYLDAAGTPLPSPSPCTGRMMRGMVGC